MNEIIKSLFGIIIDVCPIDDHLTFGVISSYFENVSEEDDDDDD